MRRLVLMIILALALPSFSQIVIRPITVSTTNTLNNGLIAFWNMSETSGTRYDTTANNNDLSDNNTVGYGTGKYGNAADLERSNSEYLTINDNDYLSFGSEESFTLSAWVKLETGSNYHPIMAKTNGAATKNFEYDLDILDTQKPRFFVGSGSGASSAEWGSTISTGTWYMITGWYDTDTDSVYVVVNDGNHVRAVATHEPHDGSDQFKIGTWSGANWFFDGLIDCAGVWGRCPKYTNGYAMIDSLYNGGAGWQP